ncbi:ATPase AAA [Vibrio inusitatus NBRC 102082]|uniref:ATPase AAA n=1 Tax=Vibrio inusitatus NBRC 102082 TaxID=1219070 RepID=A0A4Y3HYJ6_9VIBR|nr:MoxR family ATPase [Vibrio inusitatus]GEA52253.1 ATPase AAA [Vibrio inusitatus NBRC 102082]
MSDTYSNIQMLSKSLSKTVIGQQHVVEALLIALLADGHVLLEGLPGTAKTRSVRALASNLDLALNRVQFTPDLMPSDVVGYESLSNSGSMSFVKGPAFTNILLADEINRAPPKVQSALLEAMEERQVTVGGTSHELPEIFLVLATQNPVEQEGTYPLPEAQLDRFLMKVEVAYPNRDDELAILQLVKQEQKMSQAIEQIEPESILDARRLMNDVYVSESIENYIVDLVMATRIPEQFEASDLEHWIRIGSSPRATIALDKAARAYAIIHGKTFVDTDDVRAVIHGVLCHRITLSFDAMADAIDSNTVVNEILKLVEIR